MKFNVKRTALVTSLLIFSGLAMGAKITDDKVKIGTPTSGANKEIIFDNGSATPPSVRLNTTSSKLEFTNDGANYKAIGSGSGGGSGVNYLQDLNGDFEAGVTGWTNSGGTFVASSTTPITGAQSGVFTASATAQFVETSLITKQLDAGGRSCSATFDYNWVGTVGQLQARVLDSTNAVIAGPVDLAVTTSGQTLPAQLPLFDCDAASQFKVRITSTAASAAIKIDNAFIGYGKNSLQVSQADLIAAAQTSPTTTAAQTTSATYVDMTYNSTRIDVLQGRATAAVGNLAGVTIANLSSGKYEVTANFSFQITSQTTTTNCLAQIHDGTDFGGTAAPAYTVRESSDTNQNGKDNNVAISVFNYSTPQATRTFRMQAFRASGNGVCNIATVQWVIKYFPLNANNALTLETSGWRVDASISGANPSLGSANVATYAEITNAAWTMTQNSGSLPVKIPCSGTNPATGLTCAAGNESLGVQFDIPVAGPALVCAAFTNFLNTTGGTAVDNTFSVFETNNTDATVNIQSNNQRVTSQINTAGQTNGFPHQNCGIMNFSTAGTKTIRLKYTQSVTGAVVGGSISMDGSAPQGARDFHITVIPIGNQFPTPVFTDLQNSLKESARSPGVLAQAKVHSAFINNSGSACTVGSTVGNFISSVTRSAAGQCTMNFIAGTFPSVANCVAMGNANQTRLSSLTNTQVIIQSENSSGVAADASFNFICTGY